MSGADNIKQENFIFENFFKENFSSLCAYCQYKYDLDPDRAAEAVQGGFVKLWENRHKTSSHLSQKAYLLSIVTNICLDMLRHDKVKRKHVHYMQGNASAITTEQFDKVDAKTIANDIDKAVSELPLQMRHIFQLSRFEGLKNGEIAARLNISIKTVETQMTRALAKLRQKLTRYSTYVVLGLIIYEIYFYFL